MHNADRTSLGRPSVPFGPPEVSEDEVAPEPHSGLSPANLLSLRDAAWLDFSGGARFKGVCGNCFLGAGNVAARRKSKTYQELGNPRVLPRKVPACGASKLYWASGWPSRWGLQPQEWCGFRHPHLKSGYRVLLRLFDIAFVFRLSC